MRMHTKFGTAAMCGLILGTAIVATPAMGQEVRSITVRSGIGGPGESGMITRKSVDKYAALLGLDEATREAVQVSHEGYAAAWQRAQKTRREAMDGVRREVEESEDHSLWGTRLPAIEKAFRETSRTLEREFMADLKIMAGDAGQGPAFERVERMRRRELTLNAGGMSGEGVDLVDLVGSLSLLPETAGVVEPALLEYEAEMDRNTQARLKSLEERGEVMGLGRGMDPERIEAMMKETRESSAKIRDVNMRYAKKIEGALPDDRREAFLSEFRRRCFPAVYKASRVQRELDAALGMSDLGGDQREQLTLLKETYAREARTVNEAWAAAIEEQEKSGGSTGMSFGGARLMMMSGEEPEALKSARQSRRDLDKRIRERLGGVLTPEQKERLPKEQDEEGHGFQRAIFVEGK